MRLILSIMASALLILTSSGYDGYQTAGWLDYPYLGSNADRYPLELGEGRQETINISQNLSGISLPPFRRLQGNFSWGMGDDLSEYHIPALVDFLSPGYRPPGMNYSGHVPALGEFVARNWTAPKPDYSQYVPAIGAFLDDEWESPAPNPTDYPDWINEFLVD
ncbi:MAG: hypothetical protein JW986_07890 [Methanotrichaceae archaeon]|nr:hypothetical protein [Methanotrichaceae archaeon]